MPRRKPRRGGARPGAGRPRDPNALRGWLRMRISEELEARLLAAAIARGVPTAVHVREALDADLRTMGF